MRFKLKVTAALLLVGLLPTLIVSGLDLDRLTTFANETAEGQLQSDLALKSASVQTEFKHLLNAARGLAVAPATENALLAFTTATASYATKEPVAVDETVLSAFYDQQVKRTKDPAADAKARWTSLDIKARTLQQLFIFGLEDKSAPRMDTVKVTGAGIYGGTHMSHHPYFRDYLKVYGFYDIFLIEPQDGSIVYTVMKEPDFGTSLLNGPYKDSSFAKAAAAMIANQGKDPFTVVDFEPYEPSFNDQAAFILTPMHDEGVFIGIIAFQIPLNFVDEMLSHSLEQSETGDSFLVGQDQTLRSVPRFGEGMKVGTPLQSEAVERAAKGETGVIRASNHRGEEVISAFAPVPLPGLKWNIVTELGVSEALASATANKKAATLAAAIVAATILVAGLGIAQWLLAPIRKLGTEVQEQAADVVTALKTAAENARTAAEAMAQTAEETSRQSGAAKESSRLTSGNVTNVAGSVEQLSSSITEVVEGIRTTADLVDHAATRARDASILLTQLETVAERITGMVGLINDIANRTNLLALNAAVEAAHAGNAGRGFAVVAGEIRKLASRTAESTEMISAEVRTVLTTVNGNAEAIRSISTAIEQVSDQARAISANASQQGEVTTEIATRMADTATKVADVDRNIKGVEVASTDAANAANDMLGEMQRVGTSAVEMDRALTSFVRRIQAI